MTFPWLGAYLQVSFGQMVTTEKPIPLAVVLFLLCFSIFSWAIIFSKWKALSGASTANRRFLRAFRKAPGLEAVAVASEQFPSSPLVSVFDWGYSEVERQVRERGALVNRNAVERTLQIGISEEISKLERNMNWLATTATVTPFIGLFGTVWGIIDAFQALGSAGSASLRAVAPGISSALVSTAIGLAAAIPAAIAYNYFNNSIREQGTRMEDFLLEFLNLTERRFDG